MADNDNSALTESQFVAVSALTELVIELRGYPRRKRHEKIWAMAYLFYREMEDAGLSVYQSGVEGLAQWLIAATNDPENQD